MNVNDAPVGALLISDTTPAEDQVISAVNAFTDADGLTAAVFLYQWQELIEGVWTDIVGAEFQGFAADQAQVGHELRVSVTYTDDRGTTRIIDLRRDRPVTNINDEPVGTFLIDDLTPEVGQVLTALNFLFDQDGITAAFNFQWQSLISGTWTDIDGANTETFTPTTAQGEQQLRVVVSYTDDFGTAEIGDVGSDRSGAITEPSRHRRHRRHHTHGDTNAACARQRSKRSCYCGTGSPVAGLHGRRVDGHRGRDRELVHADAGAGEPTTARHRVVHG